jgi:hypothetical protein
MAAISVSGCPSVTHLFESLVELAKHWLHELQHKLPAGFIHQPNTQSGRGLVKHCLHRVRSEVVGLAFPNVGRSFKLPLSKIQ